MQAPTKNKLIELHRIISKMPLNTFSMAALPEFGVKWREVTQAVRNNRLPLQPASVARIICRHVSKALTSEEIDDIVARLRLKLVATQVRTWHVIRLHDKIKKDEPIGTTIRALPDRMASHLTNKNKKRSVQPKIETVLLGDIMYISVQLVSAQKKGSVLFIAAPPGQNVALVSSLTMVGLLQATVEGLGYKKYENASLYGRDINSLLRISNELDNANVNHLACLPEYKPMPVITASGIDYTHKKYDENYVDSILGPNPPLLTDLDIKSVKPFFDHSQLDKTISVSLSLKSDNIAKSLKCWVQKGALVPTSDFFKIFHEIKCNKFEYNIDESD